jgi:DNA polymerase III delta prime subunit
VSKHLWVEEYCPATVADCVLPQRLKKEFDITELSNMLLIGDAGTGKTTVAKALCSQLELDMMFMNASNERGLDDVRNKIQQFASTTSLFGSYKVILLDEADNLTPDAQKALRALIEQFQNNCRFIMTCNYPYKLIDPLRSRLTEVTFSYPGQDAGLINEFTKRALEIILKERVQIKETDVECIQQVVRQYYPNWRRVLYALQRICARGTFDQEVYQSVVGSSTATLIDLLKAKNFTKLREWVAESLKSGLSDVNVIGNLYREMESSLKPQSRPGAILVLAEYQAKAAVVSNPEINLVAMCVELMMNAEWL